MKIKVEKKAWYGLCLLEEGELVDYEGDEVPVWGTLASGEEVAQDGKQPEEQNEFLEKLRDLAADNDVWVEQYPIAPEEEIAFLTEELKKKGINVVQEALEV